MTPFLLTMITPERTFFSGEIVALTVVDEQGERQILANYAKSVIALPAGIVRIETEDATLHCACGEGFLKTDRDGAHLVCQTFEWPEEVEEKRVKRAIEEHAFTKDLGADEQISAYHDVTLKRAHARLSLLALMRAKESKR